LTSRETSHPAPIAVGTVTKNLSNTLDIKSVKHKQHGEGVRVRFVTMVATASSNGVTADSDSQLPILLSSLPDAITASGFQSTDDTQISGIKFLPQAFGPRFQAVASAYQRWRLRSLTAQYQSRASSTLTGGLIMAMTADPTQFVENSSSGVPGTLSPSPVTLAQCVPNTAAQVWLNQSITMNFPEDKLFYLAYNKASTSVSNTSYGDVAFIRDMCPGRFAALFEGNMGSGTYGQFWFSGEAELFYPSYNQVLVMGLWGTNEFFKAENKDDEKGGEKFSSLVKASTGFYSFSHFRKKEFKRQDEKHDLDCLSVSGVPSRVVSSLLGLDQQAEYMDSTSVPSRDLAKPVLRRSTNHTK
jgi:hypothetical protein